MFAGMFPEAEPLETYRYDAFGTLASIQSLNENGVLAVAETALSRFIYAGEQLDSTTGLYYLRARQYDTVIGRFTQEDTYLGDGRNLYAYVSNNPLKYVDPSGQCSKKLGHAIASLSNANRTRKYVYNPWGSGMQGYMEDRQTFYELMQEDAAGATNDLIIGIVYESTRLATLGVYHDPEAEKVRYEEAFQMGVEKVDLAFAYLNLLTMTPGMTGGTEYTPYYGGVGGQVTNPLVAQTTLPATSGMNSAGMPLLLLQTQLPLKTNDIGNQGVNSLVSLNELGNQANAGWNMPEGGGTINGREYSQHALERMAPNTAQVRAELSRRTELAAERLGYKIGTKEYYEFCKAYVDPRNIPPSVVENVISSTEAIPGNFPNTFVHENGDVKVIVNSNGKVITVMPK